MSSRIWRFMTRWLSHPRWPLVAGVLAIAVTLPALWTGLVADDYIHRAMLLGLPGFVTEPLGIFSFLPGADDDSGRFGLPWWSAPDLRIAFWRPVTALTHVVDYALWPDVPWLMHLQSLLWYGAAVVLVGLLFQRLLGAGWVAGLATLAYAMDPTHALSVQFIAGRNALLGVAFSAATLLLHDRWRRLGHRDGAVLAPATLALVGGPVASSLKMPQARLRAVATRGLVGVLIVLHVIVAPLLLAVRVVATANTLNGMTVGVHALAQRPEISHKLVVLMDDFLFTGSHFPAVRALSGLDPVEQILVLAPASQRGEAIVLSRPSEDRLVMDSGSDHTWFTGRDAAHRFAVGDRFGRRHVSIEVQREQFGVPTRVAFHFDRSLDDPSFVWFGRLETTSPDSFPRNGRYPAWTPPAIGKTVSVR